MAKYAELPDGTRLEFPDGVKDSVMDMVVAQHMAGMVTPQAPQEEGGAGRSFALGTRNVLEGAGGMVGSITQPIANLADWATGGSGTRFQNPGKTAADWLGLPTPQTGGERAAGAAIEGAAGALPTLGAGLALQGARALPASAQAIMASLADMPGLQIVSGLTGGAAMGGAREGGAGPAGPAGQMAAGLAGAVVPGFAGFAGNNILRGLRSTAGALDRLTPSGQERLAGTAMERIASDPNRARELAEQGGGVLVEGSFPTTAQLTADPGLAVLEKAMASSPHGAGIRERYTAQEDAQREVLNNLLNPVRERQDAAIAQVPEQLRAASPYGGNLDERLAGQMIRGAFDEEYVAMRGAVNDAYQRIDPDGTAVFDLRPLVEGFEQSLGGGRYQRIPGEISSIMNQMRNDISNGVNVTYRDLQDVRTMLTDTMQSAAATGNAPVRRMAGLMKGQLDDYFERLSMSSELMGGAPSPQPGSTAWREAGAAAGKVMDADAWYGDLDYLMGTGLNREAVERLVGAAGVDDLNRLAPGIVRKAGRLVPDTAAADLGSFESLIQQTGGGGYHADGDAFLQALTRRLEGMYGRKRQARGNIREEFMSEGAMPHTGFTLEQAQAFRDAKALRRVQGERFEQGANAPLTRRGEQLGGQAIADSAIPGAYFRPGAAGSESMEAFQRAMGGQQGARSAITDRAIASALQESTGAKGILDPSKLSAWMERYRPALSQLDSAAVENALQQALEAQTANAEARRALGTVARPDAAQNWQLTKAQRQFPPIPASAGLTADEAARLGASQADLKRVLDTQNRAAVNGSPTMQLKRAMEGLDKFRVGAQGGGGFLRNLANSALSKFAGYADDNIDRMLVDAVLDPEYAAKLMNNTNNTPGNGIIDGARRWAGRGAKESYSDMLRRYGISTSISAGRAPAQAR